MNIKKAIEHFEWKLSNHWKPTAKDIEAFNEIVKFSKNTLENNFNNNLFAAKLYVIYYGELLKYYESTVFDDIPQKELHKQLDKSFNEIVSDFIDKHHDIEMALQIPKEKRYKHPKETKLEFKKLDKMQYEETETNLVNLFNLAFSKYS
jgi:hypothetical protein